MMIRKVVLAVAAMVLVGPVSPSFAQQLAQNKAAKAAPVKSPVKSPGGVIVATINGVPIHSSEIEHSSRCSSVA